jgi:hypothetical protein
MCGFCQNVWDLIYQRRQMTTDCERWLALCPAGGCDPDVWDHINRTTHWPKGWKVYKNTRQPNWSKLPPPPETDDRVYHKRKTDGPNAKWRRFSRVLDNAAIAARAAYREEDPVDRAEWDEEEKPSKVIDLDDDDLW